MNNPLFKGPVGLATHNVDLQQIRRQVLEQQEAQFHLKQQQHLERAKRSVQRVDEFLQPAAADGESSIPIVAPQRLDAAGDSPRASAVADGIAVTPTDVYLSVAASLREGHRRTPSGSGVDPVGQPVPITLEEVLAKKLRRDSLKFRKVDRQQRWEQELNYVPKVSHYRGVPDAPGGNNSSGHPRPGTPTRKPPPKRAAAPVPTAPLFTCSKKFTTTTGLPSLGITMSMDGLEQAYNFAAQPHRQQQHHERAMTREQCHLEAQRELEDPEGELEAFRAIPPTVMQTEPFLRYLYAKRHEEVEDIKEYQRHATERTVDETNNTAEEVPAVDSAPGSSGDPRRSQATAGSVDGSLRVTGRSTDSSRTLPTGTSTSSSTTVKRPSVSPKSTRRAASAHMVRPAAGIEGRSMRPATAGDAVSVGSGGSEQQGGLKLMKSVKAKKHILQQLVARQEVHDNQLQEMGKRQRQIMSLQNQIDSLQKLQRQQQRGSTRFGTVVPPELTHQLTTLREQQKVIDQIHRDIVVTHQQTVSAPATRRAEKSREVQHAARNQLMNHMEAHKRGEQLAKWRQMKRHQRSNALLWNKNRYELQRREEAEEEAGGGPPPTSSFRHYSSGAPPSRRYPTPGIEPLSPPADDFSSPTYSFPVEGDEESDLNDASLQSLPQIVVS